MKFYIATRFERREEVKQIIEKLAKKGHSASLDWTEHKPTKPYAQNKDLAKEYAIDDIKGVRNCDVFVLLTDEAGAGMYVELGAAMASNLEFGKPKIFVVGRHDSSNFFYHPVVKRKETIEEVLKELGI